MFELSSVHMIEQGNAPLGHDKHLILVHDMNGDVITMLIKEDK